MIFAGLSIAFRDQPSVLRRLPLPLLLIGSLLMCGCQSGPAHLLKAPNAPAAPENPPTKAVRTSPNQPVPPAAVVEKSDSAPEIPDQQAATPETRLENQPAVVSTGFTQPADESDAASSLTPVGFDDVILSVRRYYPLVQAAYQERRVADGNQLAAWGEFDTKVKAVSENGPLGFYETYRNSTGIIQPRYDGGYFFGGYRNGGGNFEPWYLERETNAGGEFKGGFRVPLLRDHDIDTRRAALWRATYDQQLADPFIRASLIEFTAEAGRAYWKWVAAGRKYQLGRRWLELALDRNDRIRSRVEAQDLDPPELIDNERAIAKRQAKLADSLRVVEQSAQKLSVYLRDESGRPWVPDLDRIPPFPDLLNIDSADADRDIDRARQNRPELESLSLWLRQLQVDYAEACNLTRPQLDAQLTGAQDVGEPTSSKRDKSQFEVEAGIYFEVPVQQRKGRGKMHAVQAKMAQLGAKRRLVSDKIAAEVQAAYAGLIRSRESAIKAKEAAELADQMADIERRKFELGESDLLKVALREQYALEAAEEQVESELRHFMTFSDYAATLGMDQPSVALMAVEFPAEMP